MDISIQGIFISVKAKNQCKNTCPGQNHGKYFPRVSIPVEMFIQIRYVGY